MKWQQKMLFSILNYLAAKNRKKFLQQIKNATQVNRKVLQKILQLNKNTQFGRLYNFSDIENNLDYKKTVPLSSYQNFQPYINKITAGKQNILTKEKVIYLGLSSGTTGQQKMIPMTKRTQIMVAKQMILLLNGLIQTALPAAKKFSKGLILMNTVTSSKTKGGIKTGAATSGGMKAMQKSISHLWVSPPEIMSINDQDAANYLHLLFALQEEDLGYISAPFAPAILSLLQAIEKNWSCLLSDLAQGTISLPIDKNVKQKLLTLLKPNPERAKRLAKIFINDFADIVSKIWPQIKYVSTVTTGSFQIYEAKLRFYLGDIPIYSSVYASTESIIGINLYPNNQTYILTPANAYYEFIPLEKVEEEQPITLDLNQLEKNKKYEIVITNFSGLYRYRLGDIVEVIDFEGESPALKFLYRQGQLINLVGEKTSEEAIFAALEKAALQQGLKLNDFTTTLDYEGKKYIFFVEISDPKQFLDTNILETALQKTNPRYAASRQSKRIKHLDIINLPLGSFENLRNKLIEKGASNNQVKIPRFLLDEQLIAFLQQQKEG